MGREGGVRSRIEGEKEGVGEKERKRERERRELIPFTWYGHYMT